MASLVLWFVFLFFVLYFYHCASDAMSSDVGRGRGGGVVASPLIDGVRSQAPCSLIGCVVWNGLVSASCLSRCV